MAAVPSIGRAAEVAARPNASQADATRDLFERYQRQIFNYCLHHLPNREEAEDATQSTFLNAFRGLKRGVSPEFESAWLFKIAHNVCLTRQRSSFRRRRVESPGDLDALQDLVPSPQREADELIHLTDALHEMPERPRRALLMREWQGLSYREIGDELGLSQPAVETLLVRARRSLAKGLTTEVDAGPEKGGLSKRLRAGTDIGSLAGAVKMLLLGGSAKVAATAAAVAATSVVAATPTVRHDVVGLLGPAYSTPSAGATELAPVRRAAKPAFVSTSGGGVAPASAVARLVRTATSVARTKANAPAHGIALPVGSTGAAGGHGATSASTGTTTTVTVATAAAQAAVSTSTIDRSAAVAPAAPSGSAPTPEPPTHQAPTATPPQTTATLGSVTAATPLAEPTPQPTKPSSSGVPTTPAPVTPASARNDQPPAKVPERGGRTPAPVPTVPIATPTAPRTRDAEPVPAPTPTSAQAPTAPVAQTQSVPPVPTTPTDTVPTPVVPTPSAARPVTGPTVPAPVSVPAGTHDRGSIRRP